MKVPVTFNKLLFHGISFLTIICIVLTFPNIQIFSFRLIIDLTNRFGKKATFMVIWSNMGKSSKIGQSKESLIFTFAFFLRAIVKVYNILIFPDFLWSYAQVVQQRTRNVLGSMLY